MLIRLCLSLLQSYDTKEPKTKFLSLEYFRGGGCNSLIINTMKNRFCEFFIYLIISELRRRLCASTETTTKSLIICILHTRTGVIQKKTAWDSTDSTVQGVLLLGMGREQPFIITDRFLSEVARCGDDIKKPRMGSTWRTSHSGL